MSSHEGVNIADELGFETRVERIMFRMTLPLSDILSDVAKTLNDMQQIDFETEVLLMTTRIDQAPTTSTTECPVCCCVALAHSHHLPCGHVICGKCLSDWLAVAGSCPFCRHKLTDRKYVDNKLDPRNEAYARSILEQLYEEGRRYLRTNPADVTFRGFVESGRSDETGEVFPQMQILESLFQQFSTAFEDLAIQSDLGQEFKRHFWEENSAVLAAVLGAGRFEKLWLAMRGGIESHYVG